MRIEVGGHTDNVGNDAANQKLSEQRANAVREFLIAKGIDGTRIVAKGYGETKPIATNETEEGRAQNRRTEVTVL
jgi:OOP family OmpA-OmpF porin